MIQTIESRSRFGSGGAVGRRLIGACRQSGESADSTGRRSGNQRYTCYPRLRYLIHPLGLVLLVNPPHQPTKNIHAHIGSLSVVPTKLAYLPPFQLVRPHAGLVLGSARVPSVRLSSGSINALYRPRAHSVLLRSSRRLSLEAEYKRVSDPARRSPTRFIDIFNRALVFSIMPGEWRRPRGETPPMFDARRVSRDNMN